MCNVQYAMLVSLHNYCMYLRSIEERKYLTWSEVQQQIEKSSRVESVKSVTVVTQPTCSDDVLALD